MITQDQQVFVRLERAKNILITFPADWNGDSVASALALFLLLKKMGKEVNIAADDAVRSSAVTVLDFLPSFQNIRFSLDNLMRFIVSVDISNAKIDQIKYTIDKNLLNFIISPKEGFFTSEDVRSQSGGYQYDLIVVLGSPDLESLGRIYDNNIEFFYKTPIINLDNHPANEEFGQINFIEINAVAVGEILYYLARDYAVKLIDEDIATCLLTGIISKTKSFKTSNLTPYALATTSELIKLGARREEIVNHLYRSRDLPMLKLWGRLLNNLQAGSDGQVVWSVLSEEDIAGLPAVDDCLAEAVDELIASLPQTRAALMFYPFLAPDGVPSTRVLAYAVKNANALELLQPYHPVGSKRLAVALISKTPENTASVLVSKFQERLNKLPG